MRIWLCCLLVVMLGGVASAVWANTPQGSVVRLCPTKQDCPTTGQRRWHKQKLVGWWLQLPSKGLQVGQEVHVEVPTTVVLSELSGHPIPTTMCTRKGVSCFSTRVGQMVMFSRVQMPKGLRRQQIWLVSAGRSGIVRTAGHAYARRYEHFRWRTLLKEGSPRTVGVGTTSWKPSATSTKSNTGKQKQSQGASATAFLMDLAKTAKSRAKDRVLEQIKKRICKRLCACGKPGKKSILPRTCRGLSKHKLGQLLHQSKKLRSWLREDLFAFLQGKMMTSLSKVPHKEIVSVLLPGIFGIIQGYMAKESSYKMRQRLQKGVLKLLQQLASTLDNTPRLALLLQLTSAQIQQCMATKGPCRFDVTKLLGARDQLHARRQAVRHKAWKRWQRAANKLRTRYQAQSRALQQMPQRCLTAKSAQVLLPFPGGTQRIANCTNYTLVAFQWKQAQISMMPNFSDFLKLQPEDAYLQSVARQNRPFFVQLERLVKRIKGIKQSASIKRSQLRRGLLEQMAGVQWFLTHLHGIMAGKHHSNKERVRMFLSLAIEIAQRILKERQPKASKKIASLQKKLSQFKSMFGHLVEGQLSQVLTMAAKSLLTSSKKKGGTAFQYLTMVMSYADAARDTSPEGAAERQKLIESLFEQANDRKNRDQEWLISFGLSLGLTTGYQWLAKNQQDGYSGEFAPPQLAMPSGIAFEYWINPSFGFHFFVFALDIGQLTSYELGGSASNGTSQVNKPTIGSLLALGAHIGFVWGSPAMPFVLGIEGRYSPTLFESKDSARTGSARVGIFLGTHFHFFDFL